MFKLVVFTAALAALSLPAAAQNYGVGRTPSPDEIASLGATTNPSGKGLPAGQGTAKEGREVYELRCKECHGPEGKGADQTSFLGKPEQLQQNPPVRTVGSYWPYATTLWDYTNRAMPFDRPGTLTADQVYAVTAYILFLNGIVEEGQVLDASSLPQVQMPNREGFVPDDRPDTGVAGK
ncbi:MAG: cytochrome c [Bryobacterales bacterium]